MKEILNVYNFTLILNLKNKKLPGAKNIMNNKCIGD